MTRAKPDVVMDELHVQNFGDKFFDTNREDSFELIGKEDPELVVLMYDNPGDPIDEAEYVTKTYHEFFSRRNKSFLPYRANYQD